MNFGLLKAQDIHLTQYYFSPLNLNPAYTGLFDGDYRIVANHRSQWAAVMDNQFLTSGVSYDQNFHIYQHQFAAGINFVHDQSGLGVLQQNKLELAVSYKKSFKGHLFHGGLQMGMLHKGIDMNKYLYPLQFNMDVGSFDNNQSNMQNFTKQNIYLFDFNLGLAWSKVINDKITAEVGASFFHLNTPTESFLGNNNSFPVRKVLDAKVYYLFNNRWKIIPNLLFMHQNKAQELVWGALARFKVAPNKYNLFDVFGGFTSRNGFGRNYDAMAIIFGGKVKEYQLGISYDINMSELSSVTHYRGGFELSLIYIAKNTKPKVYNVPCDRL